MEGPAYDQVTVRLGKGQRPRLMRIAGALGSDKVTFPIKIVIDELIERTSSEKGLAEFAELVSQRKLASLPNLAALLGPDARSMTTAGIGSASTTEGLMSMLRNAMEKVAEDVVRREARYRSPRKKIKAEKPQSPKTKPD